MLASNQTKFIIHFGNELNLSLFELKPAIDSAKSRKLNLNSISFNLPAQQIELKLRIH